MILLEKEIGIVANSSSGAIVRAMKFGEIPAIVLTFNPKIIHVIRIKLQGGRLELNGCQAYGALRFSFSRRVANTFLECTHSWTVSITWLENWSSFEIVHKCELHALKPIVPTHGPATSNSKELQHILIVFLVFVMFRQFKH